VVEQQLEKQINDLCLLDTILDRESDLDLDLDCLPIGPPPGLELCAVDNPCIGSDNFLFPDDTPKAMTANAMLAGCDCENISCESFVACQENQVTLPQALVTPKNSLHICLADCIDDTSTAASESSPELFPRDLVDFTNSYPSPSREMPEQKVSPITVPSILEGLNFAPHSSPTPSLAETLTLTEALALAPNMPPMNQTGKTPISLEAMAPATPTMNRAGKAPISLDAGVMNHVGKAPISLEAMAPTTPTMNQVARAPISLEAMTPATPTMSQTGKTQISLEAMAPTTPKMNQKGKAEISLEAMLEFSPVGQKQAPGLDSAVSEATWNRPRVAPNMVPAGGVSPWWFPGFPDMCSSSNNTNELLAKSVSGFPNATAFWPTGPWGHPMHANNVPGPAQSISRASSGTADSSEVFQI
jgi:hypothetical protein